MTPDERRAVRSYVYKLLDELYRQDPVAYFILVRKARRPKQEVTAAMRIYLTRIRWVDPETLEIDRGLRAYIVSHSFRLRALSEPNPG